MVEACDSVTLHVSLILWQASLYDNKAHLCQTLFPFLKVFFCTRVFAYSVLCFFRELDEEISADLPDEVRAPNKTQVTKELHFSAMLHLS